MPADTNPLLQTGENALLQTNEKTNTNLQAESEKKTTPEKVKAMVTAFILRTLREVEVSFLQDQTLLEALIKASQQAASNKNNTNNANQTKKIAFNLTLTITPPRFTSRGENPESFTIHLEGRTETTK